MKARGLWLFALLSLVGGCGDPTTAPGVGGPGVEPPPFLRRVGGAADGMATVGRALGESSGRVLVSDARGPARLIRYDADGYLLQTLIPPAADSGYALEVLAETPDGRFWTTDSRHEHLIRLEPDGSGRASFGGAGFAPGQFSDIVAVAAGPDGTVFVLDDADPRVTVFSGEGRYLRHWSGGCPEGCGFDRPVALTVDRLGDVYVADEGLQRIFKFDGAGRWLATWDGHDVPDLDRLRPGGLAVDPGGNVGVLAEDGYDLLTFGPDGRWMSTVRVGGASPGAYYPLDTRSIAYLPNGEVLVPVRDVTGGVLRFDAAGRPLTRIGHTRGSQPGTLGAVFAIALDARRHLFTLEPKEHRVQEFDADGLFVQGWVDPHAFNTLDLAVDEAGYLYRLSANHSTLLRTAIAGGATVEISLATAGDATGVTALAVARRGELFVATRGGLIHAFEPDGTPIAHWSITPETPGRSLEVADLVLDDRQRLWAMDRYYGIVRAFDSVGQPVGGFDVPTDGPDGRLYLYRLALDAGGHVTALGSGATGGVRLYTLGPAGEVLGRWDFGGQGVGFTCALTDLAWDADGRLFLADGSSACGGVSVYGR